MDDSRCFTVRNVVANDDDTGLSQSVLLSPQQATRKLNLLEANTELFGLLDANQEARDENGASAFSLLSKRGQSLSAVDKLLDVSANVNAVNRAKMTPLMILAGCRDAGNLESAVKMLLAEGAATNATDHQRMTVLHHFAQKCHFPEVEDIVELLVDARADLTAADQRGQTPLFTACVANNLYACKRLIALGAEVNIVDRFNSTLLRATMQTAGVRIQVMIVAAGAHLNTDSFTPSEVQELLFASAEIGEKGATRALVKANANIEARDSNGRTALLLAAAHGSLQAARELIEAGAYVDSRDDRGNTALHLSCANGQLLIAKELIENGAGVDETNHNGDTPLLSAIKHGKHELISPLSEKGADINAKTSSGETALHTVARSGDLQTCCELLNCHADVEALNQDHRSALAVAAHAGKGKVCCLLLKRGARSTYSISFFHCMCNAVRKGDVATLARFVEMGESVNQRDGRGTGLLHWAVRNERLCVIRWLLTHGAGVSAANDDGFTPLHDACLLSNRTSARTVSDIIGLLLAHGADINALTVFRQTPLDVGVEARNRVPASVLRRAKLEKDLIAAGGESTTPAMLVVRLGGPPGVGKSTLTQSLLVKHWKRFFIDESVDDEAATNMKQRTKGIDRQVFTDRDSAEYAIFDLGGHGEFLASHQMFIGDGTVPVVDCVVVSLQDESAESSAFKWCSLFASRNRPNPSPWPMILIATRADKATDDQRHAMDRVYNNIKETFDGYFSFPFDEPFYIDARKSWKDATISLRQALSALHHDLLGQETALHQPAICLKIIEQLPALRKRAKAPVITKEQFISFMHPLVGLSEDSYSVGSSEVASLFEKALEYLSGFATVLVFQSEPARKYVVIEPKWLLTEIVGRLMSEPPLPPPYIHYDNGCIKKDKAVQVLKTSHLPGEAALKMTADLGFCLEKVSTNKILNPSKLCGYPGQRWPYRESMPVTGGRRLKCKGVVAIASAFFPHLQVHFYNQYCAKYGEKLRMWPGGIKLSAARRGWDEALIEADSTNLSIDIIVRTRRGRDGDGAKLLHDLTEETLRKAA